MLFLLRDECGVIRRNLRRKGTAISMKQHLTAALLLAAIGCTALTGCGDRTMNNAEVAHTAQTSAAPAQTAQTTERTTVTTRRAVTTDSHQTKTTTTETTLSETTDTHDILDHAESALDSIGDAVTSVLTKATSEVHP